MYKMQINEFRFKPLLVNVPNRDCLMHSYHDGVFFGYELKRIYTTKKCVYNKSR